jgi:hypothetical protein
VTTSNPSPSQILAAMRDHGVDVQTYKNWDTIGRPWAGPDGSPGLTGAVVHHTANPNARPGNINNILYWAVTAYDKPVCNLLIGKAPSETFLLSGGSAYHCGDGGPVPALGVPSRGFLGQTRFFGIEIDDAGVKTDSLTDYQIENTARTLAALADLCGWDVDKAIGTHKCYTDGCHGWNPNGPSPTVGRKNDTLDGAWREFPGDAQPKPYNAPFWRAETKKYLKAAEMWDGTVPTQAAVEKARQEKLKNKAAWRVACRLHDLGYFTKDVQPAGEQGYPEGAVKRFQQAQGWKNAHGAFSENTQRRMFSKVKP